MELAIKLEHFNANFLAINAPCLKRNNFSNIIYNSPTIILHNLIFPAPKMEMLSGIFKYHNITENKNKNKNKTETEAETEIDTKYYVDLSFNGYETDQNLHNFLNCINDLDDFVVDFLHKHKHELNIVTSIDNVYTRQIKKRSVNHPPMIRFKLYSDSVKTYLEDVPISYTSIKDITHVGNANYIAKSVIKCNGLRCYNGKYSLSWEIIKINLSFNNSLNNTNNSLYLFEEYNKEFIEYNRDINEEENKNVLMLSHELSHLDNNRNVMI